MDTRLINIGFGNIVAASRIIAIVSPDSAPIKRIIQEARDKGILIDATYGRRTRAVVITDSGHVVLSAVQPETVAHRFTNKEAVEDQDEDLEEEEPEAESVAAEPRMPRDRAAQAGE
jgi:extracellular matrix regulatory protein A